MHILIAEDDPTSQLLLATVLRRAGHTVQVHSNGSTAWESLDLKTPPPLAILDWMMPGLDGAEICRRVRAKAHKNPPYLILLTALDRTEHVVQGLEAGANDYVTKPFCREELLARVSVGERVIALQEELNSRVLELEDALAHVRTLEGLLPICATCKRIRDEDGTWHQVEEYVSEHSDADFTHGVCPECMEKYYHEYM